MLAFAAMLVAALSHMVAGGNTPSFLALVATTVVALPLAVLLAGRSFTLVRTLVAVSTTQALFHWIFVFVGTPNPNASGAPLPAHAEHFGMAAEFVPMLSAEAGSALAMWFAHALAALMTVWLLRRGEQSLILLQRVLLRAIEPAFGDRSIAPTPGMVRLRSVFFGSPNLSHLLAGSTITHRGPPQNIKSELQGARNRDLFALTQAAT